VFTDLVSPTPKSGLDSKTLPFWHSATAITPSDITSNQRGVTRFGEENKENPLKVFLGDFPCFLILNLGCLVLCDIGIFALVMCELTLVQDELTLVQDEFQSHRCCHFRTKPDGQDQMSRWSRYKLRELLHFRSQNRSNKHLIN